MPLSRLCRLLALPVLGLLTLVLASCGRALPPVFRGPGVPLVLEDYFTGKTRADGVFIDFFGNVGDSFVVDVEAARRIPGRA